MKKTRVNSTETFITRAIEIHSDAFDYAQAVYKTTLTELVVSCKKHNYSFSVAPKKHLQQPNGGCDRCFADLLKKGTKKKYSDTRVIEACRAIHGDYFDYSKLGYAGNKKPATFICPKHGEFVTTPWNHKRLPTGGCKGCESELRANNAADTAEDFLSKAREVHGETYDYSLVKYKTSKTKVRIICSQHGDFLQSPVDHLGGKGCRECGNERGAELRKIFKPGVRFGTRLILEALGYTKAMNRQFRVMCDCGKESTVTSTTLYANEKCAACGRTGSDSWMRFQKDDEWANKSAHFYVAKINDDILKPGIAQDPQQRAQYSGGMYEEYLFVSPALCRCEAWAVEQSILFKSLDAKAVDDPAIPEGWAGRQETRYAREYPLQWFIDQFNEHLQHLHEVGWEQLFLLGMGEE